MPWVFNPFTGKLDQTGSGGGSGTQVNSDWSATSGVEQILNKPTLFSGAYSALTGIPSAFAPSAHTHPATDVTGLSAVATTGAYSSLTGLPTIPAAQVNSDWNATSGLAQILNKPTLFSGAYSALTGTPSTFAPSSHASSHASGGSDALTLASSQITGLSAVATSGSASDLTTGTLADARLSANVALDNINNAFSVGQSINSGTLTSSSPALSLTQTWNASAQTMTGMRVNITDTASAAGSLLADFQTSGTSCFTVNKLGSTSGSGGFSFTPAANTGTFSFVSGSTGTVQFNRGGTNIFAARADSITTFNFGSSFAVGWNGDTYLYRDAANTLALRNGTNAQTSRIYGTYTDASNGRRLDITSTTAGVFTLTATGNGTGASGNLLKLSAPILLPSPSVSLATNGDLAFEATSNTTLTIRYRGSDGTTRSVALTLA